MRLVQVKNLISGDKMAISINAPNGGRILSAGVVLNDFYIERMKQMGIKQSFIMDERFDDIQIREPLCIDTRNKAIQVYKTAVETISKGKDINEDAIKDITKTIADEIKSTGLPVMLLDDMYPSDDALAFHAVNTAVLSVAIAIMLGYNFIQLCDVSLGAFLHDIGRKSLIDDNDPSHTQAGFEVLRRCGTFSIVSSAVSMQHHENFDGTGFPRAIKGANISEFGRIVSIADYFETQISSQKSAHLPLEKVLEDTVKNGDTKFDPEIVKLMYEVVQVFVTGSTVMLKDGSNAIVVSQNRGDVLRPIVRVITQSSKDYLKDIDLSQNHDLKIIRSVN